MVGSSPSLSLSALLEGNPHLAASRVPRSLAPPSPPSLASLEGNWEVGFLKPIEAFWVTLGNPPALPGPGLAPGSPCLKQAVSDCPGGHGPTQVWGERKGSRDGHSQLCFPFSPILGSGHAPYPSVTRGCSASPSAASARARPGYSALTRTLESPVQKVGTKGAR